MQRKGGGPERGSTMARCEARSNPTSDGGATLDGVAHAVKLLCGWFGALAEDAEDVSGAESDEDTAGPRGGAEL